LAFSATPAESKFAISFEIVSDPPWKFLGFNNPEFDSLALDVDKDGDKLITMNEFIANTKDGEFDKDAGWEVGHSSYCL
jgi:hypothetical protein